MTTVSVTELKAKLSEYLDKVKHGGEVMVTDRGRPIAKIGPTAIPAHDEDRAMADLVRRGVIRPGRKGGIPKSLLRKLPIDLGGRSLLKELLDMRDEAYKKGYR